MLRNISDSLAIIGDSHGHPLESYAPRGKIDRAVHVVLKRT